jgi:hypothetical protein
VPRSLSLLITSLRGGGHYSSWKKYLHRKKVLIRRRLFPTTKWDTIHTLFSMAAQNGWKIHQMNVKTAFLNGDLKDNVFMFQPEGFVKKGQEHKVCKLIKSLYGLKQTPRAWYEKLTKHLLKLNFKNFNLAYATLFCQEIWKNCCISCSKCR